MDTDLIDRIYEAAFVPEAWQGVFDGMARRSGGDTAAVLVFREGSPPRGLTSELWADVWREFVDKFWDKASRIQITPRVFSREFIYADSYMTEAERAVDPVSLSFAARGFGHQVSLIVHMPSSEVVTFTVERELRKGPCSAEGMAALNQLQPHLCRAGLLASRLGLDKATGIVSALEIIGLPGAVLTASGKVVASNRSLENLPGAFVATAFGGLALGAASSQALLAETIEHQSSNDPRLWRSIPIPASRDHDAMVAHLAPLRRNARDIFSSAEMLLVVSTIGHRAKPSETLLMGLFDLTPAEARLAQSLSDGALLADIAAKQGVSVATLRTQLRSIFLKTGTTRQPELVRMLSAARLPM